MDTERSFLIEACEAEIQAILDKYQVDLVFIAVTRNGEPCGGQFTVEPRAPDKE